jgi:hypothetical protein
MPHRQSHTSETWLGPKASQGSQYAGGQKQYDRILLYDGLPRMGRPILFVVMT